MTKQKGQIVIIVLIFIATSTILGAVFLEYLTQNAIFSGREISQEKALHLAEAGINRALYELRQSASWSGIGETQLGEGTYQVIVTDIDSSNKRIESIGFVPNAANPKAKRILRLALTLSAGAGPLKYGVQTGTGGLWLYSNAIIHGNAYSNGNIQCYSNSYITGDGFAVETISPLNCPRATSQPSASPRPLPDFDAAYWRNAANTNPSPGCPTSGSLEYNGGINTLGPCQVNGSLTLNSNAKLIMKGPIYVTGKFEMNSESQLILDESFGRNGTVLLADGPIRINSNSKIIKVRSTGVIRPNADFSVNWQVVPSGSHFSAIDEAIEKPTAGDTADYISSMTSNQTDEFDMSSLSNVATTTEIVVFVYARNSASSQGDRLGINLIIGESSQTEQVLNLTTNYSWVNATFTTQINQSRLDGLRIRLREDRAGPQDSVNVAALYAKIRYYQVGAGNIMLVSSTTTDPAIELNSQADGGVFYALNGTIQVNSNSHPVALTGVRIVLNSESQIFYDEGLADQNFTSGPAGGWSTQKGSWFIVE